MIICGKCDFLTENFRKRCQNPGMSGNLLILLGPSKNVHLIYLLFNFSPIRFLIGLLDKCPRFVLLSKYRPIAYLPTVPILTPPPQKKKGGGRGVILPCVPIFAKNLSVVIQFRNVSIFYEFFSHLSYVSAFQGWQLDRYAIVVTE